MKKIVRLVMLLRMNRSLRFQGLAVLLAGFLLAGCGTMRSSVLVEPAAGHGTPPAGAAPSARTGASAGSYVVARGDTLYSIAFRNGVDFRDLAQWNGIQAPYTIWPGQRVSLSPSSAIGSAAMASGTATKPAPVAPPFEPVTPETSAAAP